MFLANLPLDITEQELREALSNYGQIVYCLLVKDKQTGLNRGSGFLKYSNKAQAESALTAAAAQNNTLSIKSREVRVMLALDREGLDNVRGTAKKPMDKRNLYLANEGLDFSKDDNLKMSPYDRMKRERAQSEKKKKLTSPLFCVSGIRLSIRNLKKSLTSQQLKLLAFRATKKGLSSNRVNATDVSKYCEAQGLKPAECPVNPPFSMKDVKAKVMLEGGEKGTKGKGFGFIIFMQHAHALACLRELNNSIEYANEAEAEEAEG
ncbi:RNA recognition motif domain-containing protein, partial [archaeon]